MKTGLTLKLPTRMPMGTNQTTNSGTMRKKLRASHCANEGRFNKGGQIYWVRETVGENVSASEMTTMPGANIVYFGAKYYGHHYL